MTSARQRLGRWGEKLAAQHLQARGYSIVVENYRCPHGEIDLVARCDHLLVFVEVKTRRGTAFGLPEEAITPAKAEHLLLSAQYYVEVEPAAFDLDWRIDVIAVELDQTGRLVRLDYYENAVTAW